MSPSKVTATKKPKDVEITRASLEPSCHVRKTSAQSSSKKLEPVEWTDVFEFPMAVYGRKSRTPQRGESKSLQNGNQLKYSSGRLAPTFSRPSLPRSSPLNAKSSHTPSSARALSRYSQAKKLNGENDVERNNETRRQGDLVKKALFIEKKQSEEKGTKNELQKKEKQYKQKECADKERGKKQNATKFCKKTANYQKEQDGKEVVEADNEQEEEEQVKIAKRSSKKQPKIVRPSLESRYKQKSALNEGTTDHTLTNETHKTANTVLPPIFDSPSSSSSSQSSSLSLPSQASQTSQSSVSQEWGLSQAQAAAAVAVVVVKKQRPQANEAQRRNNKQNGHTKDREDINKRHAERNQNQDEIPTNGKQQQQQEKQQQLKSSKPLLSQEKPSQHEKEIIEMVEEETRHQTKTAKKKQRKMIVDDDEDEEETKSLASIKADILQQKKEDAEAERKRNEKQKEGENLVNKISQKSEMKPLDKTEKSQLDQNHRTIEDNNKKSLDCKREAKEEGKRNAEREQEEAETENDDEKTQTQPHEPDEPKAKEKGKNKTKEDHDQINLQQAYEKKKTALKESLLETAGRQRKETEEAVKRNEASQGSQGSEKSETSLSQTTTISRGRKKRGSQTKSHSRATKKRFTQAERELGLQKRKARQQSQFEEAKAEESEVEQIVLVLPIKAQTNPISQAKAITQETQQHNLKRKARDNKRKHEIGMVPQETKEMKALLFNSSSSKSPLDSTTFDERRLPAIISDVPNNSHLSSSDETKMEESCSVLSPELELTSIKKSKVVQKN